MATSEAIVPNRPDIVTHVLGDFVSATREAFGDDLVGIVLFGSAAEGALRATSDINVIVLVRAFERARADAVRGAARVAQAAIGLRAMFLRRDEVDAAAAAFAQKFGDIRRRRRVLWAGDPFAHLIVPRAALLARTNQVLLNLTLRLRAQYVERSLRDEQLVGVVAEAAAPLRTAAATILELEGGQVPAPKEALQRLASVLSAPEWRTTLARMSQARETRALPSGAAAATTLALADLAERLRARVNAIT